MDESVAFRPSAPRLMDPVRETLRFYHYAYNTEKLYVEWFLKFICFNTCNDVLSYYPLSMDIYIFLIYTNCNASYYHNQDNNRKIACCQIIRIIYREKRVSSRRLAVVIFFIGEIQF